MELACPNCETQFFVADNAIGPNGRKVRCSVCEHVWEAKNAPAAKPAATPAATVPAAPAQPAAPARTISDDEFHWPAETASESATAAVPAAAAAKAEADAPKPQPAAPKPAPAPAAERQASTSAYSSPLEAAIGPLPKQRRSGGKRMILGIILLIFVGLTYGLRDKIVAVLPQTAALYEMADIPLGAQQTALSVTDVRFTGVGIGGTAMIRVTGLVVNGGKAAAAAPMLEVTLTGTDGARAIRRSFDPQIAAVEPDQPAHFQYDLNGDVSTIGSAEVKLAPAGK